MTTMKGVLTALHPEFNHANTLQELISAQTCAAELKWLRDFVNAASASQGPVDSAPAAAPWTGGFTHDEAPRGSVPEGEDYDDMPSLTHGSDDDDSDAAEEPPGRPVAPEAPPPAAPRAPRDYGYSGAQQREQEPRRRAPRRRPKPNKDFRPEAAPASVKKEVEEFHHLNEEERQALRRDKGMIVEDETEKDNPRVGECFVGKFYEERGIPREECSCKHDPLGFVVRLEQHRMRIECDKSHDYMLHHPTCVNSFFPKIHAPDQPWGKLDSKRQAERVAEQPDIKLRCLVKGCDGFVIKATVVKEKAVKDKLEVWYVPKWHKDEVQARAAANRPVPVAPPPRPPPVPELTDKERKELEKRERGHLWLTKQSRDAEETARREEEQRLRLQAANEEREREQARKRQELARVKAGVISMPTEAVALPDIADDVMLEAQLKKLRLEEEEAKAAAARAPVKKVKEKKPKKQTVVLDAFSGEPPPPADPFAAGPSRVVGGVLAAALQDDVDTAAGGRGRGPAFVLPFGDPAAEAQEAAPAPREAPLLHKDFPGLQAATQAQDASPGELSERAVMDYLNASNFPDPWGGTPATPFILVDNLDLGALGRVGGRIGMHNARSPSSRNALTLNLDKDDVMHYRVFADGFAVVEVGLHVGAECMRKLLNKYTGTKLMVPHFLIEFPDDDMMKAVRDAAAENRDVVSAVLHFVNKRRRLRGQTPLDRTVGDLHAIRQAAAELDRAAPAAMPPPPQPPAAPAAPLPAARANAHPSAPPPRTSAARRAAPPAQPEAAPLPPTPPAEAAAAPAAVAAPPPAVPPPALLRQPSRDSSQAPPTPSSTESSEAVHTSGTGVLLRAPAPFAPRPQAREFVPAVASNAAAALPPVPPAVPPPAVTPPAVPPPVVPPPAVPPPAVPPPAVPNPVVPPPAVPHPNVPPPRPLPPPPVVRNVGEARAPPDGPVRRLPPPPPPFSPPPPLASSRPSTAEPPSPASSGHGSLASSTHAAAARAPPEAPASMAPPPSRAGSAPLPPPPVASARPRLDDYHQRSSLLHAANPFGHIPPVWIHCEVAYVLPIPLQNCAAYMELDKFRFPTVYFPHYDRKLRTAVVAMVRETGQFLGVKRLVDPTPADPAKVVLEPALPSQPRFVQLPLAAVQPALARLTDEAGRSVVDALRDDSRKVALRLVAAQAWPLLDRWTEAMGIPRPGSPAG